MKMVKEILRWLLAALFVFGGINHFRQPAFYESMVPPYLPMPHMLVVVSGMIEIVLGVLLLVSRVARWAAAGLIALLIAVFPANIYMAQHPALFAQFTPTALLIRLPLQFVLILWAFWYTRPRT